MANNSIRSRRDERRESKRAPARRKSLNRFADLQRELRTNKERWQAVIDNPFMGVTVLDRNHYFIMANPIFQSTVGYNDKELKKLTPLDITPVMLNARPIGYFLKSYNKGRVIISSKLNSCSERTASSSGYSFMFSESRAADRLGPTPLEWHSILRKRCRRRMRFEWLKRSLRGPCRQAAWVLWRRRSPTRSISPWPA